MKNHFNNLCTKQFFFAIIFLIPCVSKGQKQDNNIDDLVREREVIIKNIDSLENRLEEIEALLTAIGPENRLEAMISKYGKNKGKMIADGKVWTSISFEMAIDSWGEPEQVQKSKLSSGITEKWSYPDGKYLFFKNGRLQSWKE